MKPINPNKPHSALLFILYPIPLWLIAAGFNSDVAAAIASLLGLTLAAMWWQRLFLDQDSMLSFLRIGAISLLTIISIGWIMAIYFNIISWNRSVSQALEDEVNTTLPAYALAVVYALLFGSALAAIGGMKPVKRLEKAAVSRLLEIKQITISSLLRLMYFCCAVELLMLMTGVISYRAFAIEGYQEGQLAWFVPMLEILFATHIGLNSVVISRLIEASYRSNFIIFTTIGSVALLAFVYFTSGRSGFILCALLHAYWTFFFLGRIPKMSRIIPVLIVVLPLLYVGSLLNNFMRSSDSQLTDLRTTGFISLFNSAVTTWQSDSSLRDLEKARSSANLATRPLVVNPLAMCMSLPAGQKSFIMGRNIINSMVRAIPSNLFADKMAFPVQEDLLYQYFPIGTKDIADSNYLYAYADFGYFGLIIYPLLISFFWIFTLFFTRLRLMASLGPLIVFCTWIPTFTLSMGETSTVDLFLNARNLVIVVPLAFLISKSIRIRRFSKQKIPGFDA
jgi:hypothetical protein